MKKIIKNLIIRALSIIPLKKGNYIFSTIMSKQNLSGPNRFLNNLENGLKEYNYKIERLFLSRCKSALILSNAPSDEFHNICNKKSIKTIIRVDGFYYPEILDKKGITYKKELISKIDITQRMQRDLIFSDWVVYQSNFSKQMADKYLFKRDKNYSIIYNGVNLTHFKPKNIKKDKFTIMILGNLRDEDLLLFNLEVFKKIKERIDCKFNIIGSMTDNVKSIVNDWIDKNEYLKDDIKVFGRVYFEELPDVINQADVSLHLKAGDWCPNAVLETMACGVPVICQRYGGTAELVGSDDLIVEYNKPFVYDEELVDSTIKKIFLLYSDLEKYKQYTINNIQKFSLENMVKNYLKVLN